MALQNKNFVIGVDGGATKTIAALADLEGRILKISNAGSSNPRNVGVRLACENVVKALRKVIPKDKSEISSVFVGLPAVQEEFSSKLGEIKKLIWKAVKIKPTVGSDQLVAFRSGTNKKDGIVLIAGTGSSAHGWKGKKEHKSSGWGWLADEGSAFWIGQRYYQAVLKGFDGRGQKTRQKPFLKIYSGDFIKNVSAIAVLCDSAAHKGDKVARSILAEAGLELALSAKSVIKKLNFSKERFPLVLVGSVWKSKYVLDTFKKEVKKFSPKAEFILPKKEPVVGAVKLAIERIKIS